MLTVLDIRKATVSNRVSAAWHEATPMASGTSNYRWLMFRFFCWASLLSGWHKNHPFWILFVRWIPVVCWLYHGNLVYFLVIWL